MHELLINRRKGKEKNQLDINEYDELSYTIKDNIVTIKTKGLKCEHYWSGGFDCKPWIEGDNIAEREFFDNILFENIKEVEIKVYKKWWHRLIFKFEKVNKRSVLGRYYTYYPDSKFTFKYHMNNIEIEEVK